MKAPIQEAEERNKLRLSKCQRFQIKHVRVAPCQKPIDYTAMRIWLWYHSNKVYYGEVISNFQLQAFVIFSLGVDVTKFVTSSKSLVQSTNRPLKADPFPAAK